MSVVRLTLPLPPSQNANGGRHYMAKHAEKRRYQRMAWGQAVSQSVPKRSVLPVFVRMVARFYVVNIRDEDNLSQSLKWPLDTLKAKQRGNLAWRSGLYESGGYFWDDDPANCEVEKPEQEIDRKNPRLELTIYAAG